MSTNYKKNMMRPQSSHNVSAPIDDVFNAVEDLCKITELENCPYSARQ